MNRMWKIAILIASIVSLDQLTKWIIRSNFHVGESIPVIKGLFSITYVRNPGAAFGFLASANDAIRTPLLFILPVLAGAWLIYLMWQTRKDNPLLNTTYALIFAGAVGNLIDRFTFNYVVDFLDFYWGRSHFPAFNVADSCITVAAGLLIFDFIVTIRKKCNEKQPE